MQKIPRVISDIANPFVIFTALYVAVALVFSDGVHVAVSYVLLELLAAGIVAGYVFWMRRRKRVGDFWISSRAERLVPALVLLAAFVGLLVGLHIANSPPEVFLLTLSMGIAAATVAAITLVWKASAHAAVAGHCAVAGCILLGWFGLLFVVLMPLVLWARVSLKAHTLTQVVVGAGIGGAFAYLLLV